MKRRGFTLVELLIVIAVMGILSSMAMISGQEATDMARASNIIDGFEKISTAMMIYYADNTTAADNGTTAIADLVSGIQAYIKDKNSVVATSSNIPVGKYVISLVGKDTSQAWWITYKLTGDATKIGEILKTKADRLGLKKSTSATTNDYDGKATVCMKVR